MTHSKYLRPLLQLTTVAICLVAWLTAERLYALTRETPQTFGEQVVGTANRYLAIPYGAVREGRRFDCSGLVQHVYGRHGIVLPRRALEQATVGEKIALDDVRAGDLLFFTNKVGSKSVDHVAIALGDGRMVHASLTRHRIVIDPVNAYFQQRLLVARRVQATEAPSNVTPRIALAD
jgi:cell wall-associated NlpC family hydrolase